jgi:hypothetical protein
MSSILLKIKNQKEGKQIISQASLETEEDLKKTWRICTKVKDILENGIRLENLSWRLWHLHKLIITGRKHPNNISSIARQTTEKLNLNNPPDTSIFPKKKIESHTKNVKDDVKNMEHSIKLDDIFGTLNATAFFGDVENGPRLEIPSFPFSAVPRTTHDALSESFQHNSKVIIHPEEDNLFTGYFDYQWTQGLVDCPPLSHQFSSSFLKNEPILESPLSYGLSPNSLESANNNMISSSSLSPTENYSMQICDNCGVDNTPIWRRVENGTFCNACGLYLKLHNTARPKLLKNNCVKKSLPEERPSCMNCSTLNTPLWRRTDDGRPLCNACGLYYKTHQAHRPLSMKTNVIKKRQRDVSNKPGKKIKMDDNVSLLSGVADIPFTIPIQYHQLGAAINNDKDFGLNFSAGYK